MAELNFTSVAKKACTKCGTVFELSLFNKDKRASDGKTSNCKKCQSVLVKAWNKANPEAGRMATAKYRAKNPGAGKEALAIWRASNKDKLLANQKRYAANNPEKILENVAAYARNNRHKMNAKKALHEAEKIRATPSWADRNEIAQLYKRSAEVSKSTGIRHDVDHIVPLRGLTVSGLHVACNLQVITKDKNMKKSNKHWPDMP